GAPAGADPQCRLADQQLGRRQLFDGFGDGVWVLVQRCGELGSSDPALEPDGLQHSQFRHGLAGPSSRSAASMTISGEGETTSVFPLSSAACTAVSELSSSFG